MRIPRNSIMAKGVERKAVDRICAKAFVGQSSSLPIEIPKMFGEMRIKNPKKYGIVKSNQEERLIQEGGTGSSNLGT